MATQTFYYDLYYIPTYLEEKSVKIFLHVFFNKLSYRILRVCFLMVVSIDCFEFSQAPQQSRIIFLLKNSSKH